MRAGPAELALGWLTVGGTDPFDWLAAAHAGGFKGLGVKIAPRPGEPEPGLLRDEALRREFSGECRRTGIRLLNMGSIWLDGGIPPQDYARALDVGAELGAEYVVGISTDSDAGRRRAEMRVLAAMARERGMRLTIEFFAYSAIRTFDEASGLVAEMEDRQAGILFDALHFHRSGGVLSDITTENAGRVDYFQLCDAPRALPKGMTLSEEGRCARLFPGEGGIALREIMKRLPASIGIEVEIPHPALKALPPVERGREAMRNTLSFLDGAMNSRPA